MAPTMDRALTVTCMGPMPAALHPTIPGTLPTNGVLVHFAHLEEHRKDIKGLSATLDLHERDRADRFRSDHDRERYIIGHGLLRLALGRLLGTPATDIDFVRGPHGKPYVEGTELEFNLSDTKDAVILAIRPGIAIGADVETMRRTTDHAMVSAHYFTPGEVEDIRAAADGKRRFLELWTRKEAVLKACGVGIMEDLRSLRVDRAHNALRISHPEFVRMAAPAYDVHTFHLGEDHLVSLASEHPIGTVVFAPFPA